MKKFWKLASVGLACSMAVAGLAAFSGCDNDPTTVEKEVNHYIYVGYAETEYHDTKISLKVNVTVTDNKISAIEVVDYANSASTDGFVKTFRDGAEAFIGTLINQSVSDVKALTVSYDAKENTIENVVAGATVSSNLLVEAVQNGLNGVLPSGGNSGSGSQTEEEDLFRAQCEAAGVTVPEYEDPNAPIYEAEGEVAEGDVDLVTGASAVPGADTYIDGSYKTYEYMATRFGLKYYYSVTWKAAADGAANSAKTLAEAAALPNAKYIRAEFPNDGSAYTIQMSGNALSSKTLSTVDSEGNVASAVFGGSIREIDGKYYVMANLTTKQTILNLLETNDGLLLVYEYDPTSPDKMGAGTRNFGCKLKVTLDRTQSVFLGAGYASMGAIGDASAMPEGSVGATLYLEVTEMNPLG